MSFNEQVEAFLVDELKICDIHTAGATKDLIIKWEHFRLHGPTVKVDDREVWRSADQLRRYILRGSGTSRFDGYYVDQFFVDGEWKDIPTG